MEAELGWEGGWEKGRKGTAEDKANSWHQRGKCGYEIEDMKISNHIRLYKGKGQKLLLKMYYIKT